MRYEYIDPIVDTTIKVLDRVIQCDISKGMASMVSSDKISEDIAIIVWLKGDSDGGIILGMPEDTAIGICSAMSGEDYVLLTPEGLDALTELANMIAGNTTSVLNDLGYDFKVSPPQVLTRDYLMKKSFDLEAFQLPLFTEYGEMMMNVALRTN